MVWVYDPGFTLMRRGRLRLPRVVNPKPFYNLHNTTKWLNYVWSTFLNKDTCIIIKWFFYDSVFKLDIILFNIISYLTHKKTLSH